MKKLLYSLIAVLLVSGVSAQNPTLYFMDGSTMRSQWNPAFAPQRGYFNIPFLGGIQAEVQGNLALDDILYLQNGNITTILSSAVSASEALSGLKDMNRIGASVNMNLLGFGAYTKNGKNFWSFDVNMRADASARAPYELFDFMKTGKAGNFSNLGFGMDSYIDLGFTYSMPVIDKLYVGVRAKFLTGVVHSAFNFDQFDAYMGADRWYAKVVGTMEISGMIPEITTNEDGTKIYDLEDFGSVEENIRIPSGYGFGVDIGATYDVLPELQVSLSVCDLGFMSWSKDSTAIGRVDTDAEFTGVEVDADGNIKQSVSDLGELDFEVVDEQGVSKVLHASINAGAEYNFFDRKIGLGLFYRAKFWEYVTQHNITTSANFRPMKWLHLSGSYSFLNNRGHSVGLAFNLCPGFINLYVATDVLLSKKTPQWIPISQSNMNLTFGLAVPMGRKGLRNASDNF